MIYNSKNTGNKLNITALYLDNNRLGSGRIQIGDLQLGDKLKDRYMTISLRKNQLKTFPNPASIPNVTTTLDLSGNSIDNTKVLEQHPCIRRLRMSGNRLAEIPMFSTNVRQCNKFKDDSVIKLEMDLSYNHISTVKSGDFVFPNAKCDDTEYQWKDINLSGNKIVTIGKSSFNHKAHWFNTIDLSDNHISVVDYSVIDSVGCPDTPRYVWESDKEVILYNNKINCTSQEIENVVERYMFINIKCSHYTV